MAILAECPQCHKKQAIKHKLCTCGGDLVKLKKANKVRYWINYRLPDGRQRRESVGFSIQEAEYFDRKIKKKVYLKQKPLKLGPKVPGCPFCIVENEDLVIERMSHVYSIEDRSPVTPGHILIIPIRHAADYFEMTEEELDEVDTFILSMREYLLSKDPTITGFNIGMNCGQSAGQSVMHAHFPLIPRRDGDTENPRGGVMGMIPEKMDY
jgi:diadenosine tetraphosphate (Ap4A) HIT family hydrolase